MKIFSISLAAFVEIKKSSSSCHWRNIEFSNSDSEMRTRMCIIVVYWANGFDIDISKHKFQLKTNIMQSICEMYGSI